MHVCEHWARVFACLVVCTRSHDTGCQASVACRTGTDAVSGMANRSNASIANCASQTGWGTYFAVFPQLHCRLCCIAAAMQQPVCFANCLVCVGTCRLSPAPLAACWLLPCQGRSAAWHRTMEASRAAICKHHATVPAQRTREICVPAVQKTWVNDTKGPACRTSSLSLAARVAIQSLTWNPIRVF